MWPSGRSTAQHLLGNHVTQIFPSYTDPKSTDPEVILHMSETGPRCVQQLALVEPADVVPKALGSGKGA